MKVYLETDPQSRTLNRIVDYLYKYLPDWVEPVTEEAQADLIILYVIGRLEHTKAKAKEIKRQGKNYSILQCVLKSSRNPNPLDWLDLWKGAKLVWSYYDLSGYDFNFYHSPLGADSNIFQPLRVPKQYRICTTGNYGSTECLAECEEAARLAGGKAINSNGVCDSTLNRLYNSSSFVSGLRRKEGFEMPAAEALLCGVRPIMFDKPCFKQWFAEYAEFIPETCVEKTIKNLAVLLSKDVRPVTEKESREIAKCFDWKRITKGFWERCK